MQDETDFVGEPSGNDASAGRSILCLLTKLSDSPARSHKKIQAGRPRLRRPGGGVEMFPSLNKRLSDAVFSVTSHFNEDEEEEDEKSRAYLPFVERMFI